MAKGKKRTSLEAVFSGVAEAPSETSSSETITEDAAPSGPAPIGQGRRPGIKQQTAYLPLPVYEQLRHLAFEERAKMHDYLLEGLDRVFQARGLPSIAELTGKQK